MWRLSDEQRAFREHLRAVVLDEVRPRVREIDERCDYPHDIHATLAREGFFALPVPMEDGGPPGQTHPAKMNRPGSRGGSDLTEGWGHGCTMEVSAGVAGSCSEACRGGDE